ncbi:MAG: hypothetical protein LBG28_11580, partial [Tannerella sp.]|nr:hypothetical protein [Tannerella sp.]
MNKLYIYWTLKDLKNRFAADFSQIYQAAMETVSVEDFKQRLTALFPYDTIRELIRYDGKTITDFSTGKEVSVKTFGLLYAFLRGETCAGKSSGQASRTVTDQRTTTATTGADVKIETDRRTDSGTNKVSADLLTDLYFVFRNTQDNRQDKPITETKVIQWARQWPSGLNPHIQQVREANKQRITGKLIQRLGRRLSVNTPYYLPQFWSFEEKQRLVNEWWNHHRFHLYMAIKNPEELNFYLDKTLSEETMQVLRSARKKNIPFFVTPYYASLLDVTESGYDDKAIRSYILYSKELVETFGEIKAWEKEDEVEAGKANAAGWILPEGQNIHRRYPEVAILIPDSAGRSCGGLCASCQRMYDF